MEILNLDKNFKKKLRKIRKALCLTQEQMAERLHVTKQTIFRYEKGEVSPGLNVLIYLTKNLKVNLNWLLNEKHEGEEMFLKEEPEDYGEFAEEVKELKFLLDYVPFVRAAILKYFVLYKFENKIEIKKFMVEKDYLKDIFLGFKI